MKGELIMSRIELYLLVDHSGSTRDFIDQINKSIRNMIESLKRHHEYGELMGYEVRFIFIPFNHGYEIKEYQKIDDIATDTISLEACGATDIGTPIIKATAMALENYRKFKLKGIPMLHPIIFLFTDGVPDAGIGRTDAEQAKYDRQFEKAAKEIKESEDEKLSFVACSFQGTEVGSTCYRQNTEKIKTLTNHPKRVIEISKYKSSENPIADFFEKYLIDLFIATTQTTDSFLRDGMIK